MGKTIYMECNSGISGDMMVAALLDLGADYEYLKNTLLNLGVKGFDIEYKKVKKAGISCGDFNVILDKEHENHDHDMEYLYGHEHHHDHEDHHDHEHHHDHEGHHDHEHHHDHESQHDHEHHHDYEGHHDHEHHHDHEGHHDHEHHHDHEDHHDHEHHHDHEDHHDHEHHHDHQHSHDGHGHHHHHEHRGVNEIFTIIDNANISEKAKAVSKKIFMVIAEAEAKAHDSTIENVHFHEVGAVDSIVDVIAVAVCLDNLGIDKVIVPYVCEGHGTIRCQHGILPVPVPAVASIVASHGIALKNIQAHGEFVTPTGAAIIAAIRTSKELPDNYVIKNIGMGAGKREYERANILRIMEIEDEATSASDYIYKLESNIDDCTGENLGFVMEKLFAAGARDVHYFPVFMKKNRPGWQINVVCEEKDIATMENIIFKDTTTIGIRKLKMERSILPRKIVKMDTEYGMVDVKVCQVDGVSKYYPEYESVANICRETDLSYMEVYANILANLKM